MNAKHKKSRCNYDVNTSSIFVERFFEFQNRQRYAGHDKGIDKGFREFFVSSECQRDLTNKSRVQTRRLISPTVDRKIQAWGSPGWTLVSKCLEYCQCHLHVTSIT